MRFRDYMTAPAPEGLSVSWLMRAYGAARNLAIGDALDSLLYRMKQALKMRFPAIAPLDALPIIGSERGIERGYQFNAGGTVPEPIETYRARLVDAWNTWARAGSAYGLLLAIRKARIDDGGQCYLYVPNNARYSLDIVTDALVVERSIFGTPITTWESAIPPDWSAFSLVFTGVRNVASNAVAAGSDSSDVANLLRRIILAWKPAHTTCAKIRIFALVDGASPPEEYYCWDFGYGAEDYPYIYWDEGFKWASSEPGLAPADAVNASLEGPTFQFYTFEWTPPVG